MSEKFVPIKKKYNGGIRSYLFFVVMAHSCRRSSTWTASHCSVVAAANHSLSARLFTLDRQFWSVVVIAKIPLLGECNQ